MTRLAEVSPGLRDFSSLSGYFIHQILEDDSGKFDFSLDHILYLCEIEPQNCSKLIGTLDTALDRFSESNGGNNISQDKEEDDSNSLQYPAIPSLDKNYMVDGVGPAGVPKYIFLLGFLPFFPVIVLFAGASALALVATISLEFLLSLILPDRREVTFGKVWVGLTFLFFAPILYFIVKISYDIIASLL